MLVAGEVRTGMVWLVESDIVTVKFHSPLNEEVEAGIANLPEGRTLKEGDFVRFELDGTLHSLFHASGRIVEDGEQIGV